MTETARLVIAVDSTQVSRADSALQKFGNTTSVVERQADTLSSTVSRLAGPLAALTAGVSIKGLIDISDNYGQMADRIKMATDSTQEYVMVQDRLLQSANKTYRPLVEAQELYIRTADAIRSLGYETSDALDITDSFSYLLVTNAASADRASSAINAYSKAIQTGKVDSESWQSLLAAMPSVVETLASELGKSSNEIRELGITGKLALADLNEGLRRSVEENQRLADGMGTTLNDAIIRASNNWSAYLGESEKVTGASRLMSGALDTVSENLSTVASIASGVAVAGVTRYSVALAQNTSAAVLNYRAKQVQAAEELKAAQAQAASTAAALAQARANVGLVGSIGSVTAATAAHEAAQKRLAVAQAATMGVGRSMLGLMGGPVGLVATVGLTALSFVEFGDKAKGGMDKAANATEQAAMRIRNATRNLLPGDIGTLSYDALQEQVAKVESQLASARGELERLQAGFDAGNISEQWLDKPREKVAALEGALSKLKGEMDGVRFASDTAGESYANNLERQAVLVGKVTEEQRLRAMVEAGYIKLSEKDLALAIERAKRIDAVTASLKGSTSGVNEQANAYQALYDRLYPAEAAQRRYTEEVDRLKTVLKGNELADAIARLNAEMLEPGADATGPADAIEEYRKELERLEDKINPAGKAAKDFAAEQKRLREEIERTGDPTGKWTQLLQENERQFEQNTRATSDWAKWTEGALDRVDGAFADAWRNIGDGFSSFRDSLTSAFKQMLAELAHMAITRPIVMQIGAALGIGGGTGQAVSMLGGSAGSGGGMGIGSLLQYGQTAYSAITGVGPAALAGWQSGGLMGGIQGVGGYYGGALSGINAGAGQVIGTLLNGGGMTYAPLSYQLSSGALNGAIGGLAGIGGALYGYSQAGLKGAATGGLGAWGGATLGNILLPGIGGIIGGALGSALGGSLFGGDWETKDVGLAFSVENGDFLGQQYEYQKKKGGLFSSNKKRTRFSALDDETAARFQSVYDATEDTVAGLFESLSYSVEEASLAGLQLARTKISTKGKTEEQIQEAIAEWFGSAADAMTAELNKVFNTGLDLDFEGMQAFVGNLQGVNEVLRYLDVEMYDASVAGGKLAEALSAAAGGLEALATNSQTYYAGFFTDAEKVEDTIDSITRAFESADVELAASREAYRAMVEDIDLTTEAGQEMFATLMALSGQAAQYFSIVEQQAAQATAAANAALFGAVDTAYAALQRSIAAQQQEIQQAASVTSTNINALTGVSNSLDAALKRLRGTSDDAVRSLRAQAVMTLNSALVQARSGQSLAGFAGLQDALDVASQMDTALYSSLTDFEREQGRTANLIAELEKVNGKQLTAEQQMLKQYESQLSKLDQQLAFAQSQLDALNGIDNSIMGVAAAIAAMNASVVAALGAMPKGAAQANTPQNNGAIVSTLYNDLFGRTASAEEVAYWSGRLGSGNLEYSDIAANMKQWASAADKEAMKQRGIPGFASGGFTGYGDKWDPAGIVHKGEVVWSQSDIAKWGGVGTVEALRKGGPELEVTGPSRIYNASQTAAMLGGAGSTEELRALRGEVAGLRSALGAIAKYTESTAYGVRQMNEIGLPQGEAA
ncbi:tape measure protein [Stutzerimonas kunmingensis]|uniref:tape measure protein n=1 Tax=Stutzerimonas kunmingensis TaxID=1211807 RepID=UPI0028A599C2|nr:tape measure protein [Stutzerimonas kunmingensis]